MEMVGERQNQPKIYPKQLKIEETVEDGEEDRISELPDCLLLEILSCLPSTKYAIRTGALSKRWKHVWTFLATLIFEYHDDDFPSSGFFSFVDKTLTQCRQMKLKKFQVYTGYDIHLKSHIGNWIGYAISHNVEMLHLGFWNLEPYVEVLLDQIFFTGSCFTDLTLVGCELNPTGTISWKNLRSLCIRYGKFDEDLMKNILSGCPLLETLVLERCYGYRQLNITSKSVKNLVFYGYVEPFSIFGGNMIKINAPNILSLTIKDELVLSKLLLVNMSSIVEANLNYYMYCLWEITHEDEEEMLKGFILNLHHAKEIKIGGSCSEVMSRLEVKGFMFPSNLKYPVVIHDSCDVVSN